ncbi:MAG: DUF2017 family protein [Planctomycetota bacterium]
MFEAERGAKGVCQVSLPAGIVRILEKLPERLDALLANLDFQNRVVRRLFPPAYDDVPMQEEYARLLGNDLRDRKRAGLKTVSQLLRGVRVTGDEAVLTIPEQYFDTVLQFLNDMRLVFGTELGIENDHWEKEQQPEREQRESYFLLHLLTYLEGALLRATGLPDPPSSTAAPSPSA